MTMKASVIEQTCVLLVWCQITKSNGCQGDETKVGTVQHRPSFPLLRNRLEPSHNRTYSLLPGTGMLLQQCIQSQDKWTAKLEQVWWNSPPFHLHWHSRHNSRNPGTT